MTRDDIIRMAKESGLDSILDDWLHEFTPGNWPETDIQELDHFVALIAAAEREACAKVCEEKKSKYEERASKPEDERDIDPEVARIAKMTCDFNAAAIRARGQT